MSDTWIKVASAWRKRYKIDYEATEKVETNLKKSFEKIDTGNSVPSLLDVITSSNDDFNDDI